MTEDNATFIKNACRVCLNTTEYLYPVPNELIKWYINLVEEAVYKEYPMKMCMICRWMLLKFSKFTKQCLTANHMLSDVMCMGLKFLSEDTRRTSHGMDQTKPVILSYTPPFDDTYIETYSVHTHNTLNNETHIASYINISNIYNTEWNDQHNQCFVTKFDCATEDDKYLNDNDRYINENDKCTNEDEKFINESDKCTNEDEKCINESDLLNESHDFYEDEDEIPLVMISGMRKRKTKKVKVKKKIAQEMTSSNKSKISQDSVAGAENEIKTENKVKCKKSKKVLRDGFSSRMVQETSEYVVIKLTKEQVLQEMSERAKTEAYVSSPYKCAKCVKGFNFQDVLHAHMDKHSTKNGTFACDICQQYCPSAVSLRGHIKSHTTRYKCKICGTVRVSRQHLMEHHAGHSGAAPHYQCLQCTFTTDKRTVMQRHARAHSRGEPHACDQCGKLFKNIHYLRLHTARHDKSSRYKCPHCPATFLYHSLVRGHVRCAHERKEFYCVECDVHFKCAESLRVHFKKAKRHRDPSTVK